MVRGLLVAHVLRLVQHVAHQRADVLVRVAVVDRHPVAPRLHQTAGPQPGQVLRDGRGGPPEPVRERLLETLRSWLRHWGSRTAVADELRVHPQTVSYRVRQLRELLGDALDDADARFELALVLADPVGRRVPAAYR